MNHSQENHNRELVQRNRELMRTNEELEKENGRLKQENDNLIDKYQNQEKELSGLKDQVKSLTDQNKDLDQQKKKKETKISELEKDLKNSQDEVQRLQKCEQEKQTLQQKVLELERRLHEREQYIASKKIDDTKEFIQYKETKTKIDELKEFYDCRIGAESFFPLLQEESWPIEVKDWEDYKKKIQKRTVKVAVLGYENVGKSWMLSQLMKTELPQGKSTKTRGLCLLHPKDFDQIPWIALDTPGSNVSVKVESLKKEERMQQYLSDQKLSKEEVLRIFFGDNILIETLLQEFVVKYAEVLLVIVGKMKRDDQKLISRIRSLPGKRILIVHNLMEVRELEDVDSIIKEDVVDVFDVTKKEIYVKNLEGDPNQHNRIIYLDNEHEKTTKVKIEHLIIAHEGSPAGDYYNSTTLSYIIDVIRTTTSPEKWELLADFQNYLNVHLKKFLSHLPGTNFEEAASVLMEKNDSSNPIGLKLKNSKNYELKLSSANEFGRIETFEKEGLNNVPFTVKIFEIEDQKFLRVEFEIVGECYMKDLKIAYEGTNDNEVRIIIRGKSQNNMLRKDEEQLETSPVLENTRKFGRFKIETEMINLGSYSIFKGEMPEYDDKSVQGLKIFTWVLEPDETGF